VAARSDYVPITGKKQTQAPPGHFLFDPFLRNNAFALRVSCFPSVNVGIVTDDFCLGKKKAVLIRPPPDA
jgi:hypothetical protein